MPKVSDEHMEGRRRQIIDAAIACFARDGFHRATMQDICAEAGLSPGAIYRHFPGKDAIIEAIADERHAREAEFMRAALEVGGVDGLRVFGRASFRSLAAPAEKRRRRLGVQVWAEAVLNPDIRKLVMRGTKPPRDVVARLVREAQESGELADDLDPDAVGRVMLALFQGFILQQAWEPGADVTAFLETAELMVDALARERVAE